MSNVSTPPGRGGRLKITRCLHLEQILGFSSSQAKASSRLPGRPAWFGRGVWRGGRASQGGTPGATCARGPNAHVRSRRQATGQPRKPSVATRWTEPGRGAGTAAALSVPRMGAARGAAPPAPLPSHVSGAESPTQQPREGAQEAGAWRPGHGRPQEQGRVSSRLCGFRQALPLSGPRRSAPEPWSGAGRPAPIPVSPGAGWAGNRRAVAPLHALVSLSAENGCCAVRRADRRVLHFTGAEIGDQG